MDKFTDTDALRMREALEKIARETKTYKGHGDFDVAPACSAQEAQDIARAVISSATDAEALPVTNRGFARLEFKDSNGQACILQKSSWAEDDAIWFGLAKSPEPHHVTHESVSATMHLTAEKVAELLPMLRRFAVTGDLS